MLYPLYVWKNEQGSYSARFPDFPGVSSASGNLEELPARAHAAVVAEFSQGGEMADASPVDRWSGCGEYANGFWMLVEIDRSKINPKSVRVNISLPEKLLNDIDSFTKSRNWTRSGFLAQAAMKAMGQ